MEDVHAVEPLAIGLEERVLRLEHSMAETIELVQQMRRSRAPVKPLAPRKS